MNSLSMESPHVGKLVASRECLEPDIVVRAVADRFLESTELDALALVEGRNPVGLVTRPKLFFTVFRRYGFELYGRKPIIAIADRSPLIIHADERLDVAIDKALERPPQDIYDDIIVVNDAGSYSGLLSVKQMVVQQSNVLANSVVQKEMARERAKELEKVNQVKSQFIANVTHELRSPVNVIIGLAELMKMSCEKGHVDQLRNRLSILMSSATNLRAIITNILDLSKIEAGKMEVFAERFDAASLLYEVAETTRILVGGKPVAVEVVVRDGPVSICSDIVKVRQILTNLTSNAAKFTDRGKIVLELARKENCLALSVSDTGPGIEEEHLGRLFVAFSQIENAHTKRHAGTGLGLTITKNLVELLGGRIDLSSELKMGSTFTVVLPLIHTKEGGLE